MTSWIRQNIPASWMLSNTFYCCHPIRYDSLEATSMQHKPKSHKTHARREHTAFCSLNIVELRQRVASSQRQYWRSRGTDVPNSFRSPNVRTRLHIKHQYMDVHVLQYSFVYPMISLVLWNRNLSLSLRTGDQSKLRSNSRLFDISGAKAQRAWMTTMIVILHAVIWTSFSYYGLYWTDQPVTRACCIYDG